MSVAVHGARAGRRSAIARQGLTTSSRVASGMQNIPCEHTSSLPWSLARGPLSRPLPRRSVMKHPRLLAVLALCAFALTSCGRTSSLQSPTGGGTSNASNDAAVANALQSSPEFVNEPVWQDDAPSDVSAQAGIYAAITPLRFVRHI